MMHEFTPTVFLILIISGIISLELGYRSRRQMESASPIAGTMLLVVFLLQIFSLALLLWQHRERTTLVHEEADIIAQAFRRSTMFPDQQRRWLRTQLGAVIEVELSDLDPGSSAMTDHVEDRIHPIFDSLTQYTAKMELSKEDEIRREPLIEVVTRLISIHYRLRYALRERLPAPLYGILYLSFILGGFLAGAGNQSSTRREWVTWTAYLLISISLLNILQDLDDPLHGSISTPFENLKEIRVAFLKDPT